MSTAQYNLLYASQFGSGSIKEMHKGSLEIEPSTTFSLVTPPSVPTGRSLGSYALQLSLSSATATYTGRQINQPNSANGWCYGYWFYPITNPSVSDLVIPFVDDGLANGISLYWKTDKTIAAFDYTHSSQVQALTAAPDAASPKWFFIIIVKPASVGSMRLITYSHNGGTAGDDTDWDAIDDISFSHTQGAGIYPRIVSFSSASGSWNATNFYVQDGIGSGPVMPIGKDMLTTVPTGKTVDSTSVVRPGDSGTATGTTATTLTDTGKAWSTNQWSDGSTAGVVTCGGKTMTITSNTGTVLTGTGGWSGGGFPAAGAYTIAARNDTTTGATDTEYQYLDEIPPVDTAADVGGYIQHSAGSAFLSVGQSYSIASGLVTGLNILGVSIGGRFYKDAGANNSAAAAVGRAIGTMGAAQTFNSTDIIEDTWICDPYYASSYETATTPFTPTDIDNLTLRHLTSRGGDSQPVRISQIWVTVVTGTDDTPTIPTPGAAVRGELRMLWVG